MCMCCDVADQQLTDAQAKKNVYHLQHLSSNMLSNILTLLLSLFLLHLYESEIPELELRTWTLKGAMSANLTIFTLFCAFVKSEWPTL